MRKRVLKFICIYFTKGVPARKAPKLWFSIDCLVRSTSISPERVVAIRSTPCPVTFAIEACYLFSVSLITEQMMIDAIKYIRYFSLLVSLNSNFIIVLVIIIIISLCFCGSFFFCDDSFQSYLNSPFAFAFYWIIISSRGKTMVAGCLNRNRPPRNRRRNLVVYVKATPLALLTRQATTREFLFRFAASRFGAGACRAVATRLTPERRTLTHLYARNIVF